jgi:hypothetical protein
MNVNMVNKNLHNPDAGCDTTGFLLLLFTAPATATTYRYYYSFRSQTLHRVC